MYRLNRERLRHTAGTPPFIAAQALLRQHVDSMAAQRDTEVAELGSVAAQRVSGGLKDELWLVPIEDRRERGALREGMRSGLSLGQYLMLVEPTSSNQA